MRLGPEKSGEVALDILPLEQNLDTISTLRDADTVILSDTSWHKEQSSSFYQYFHFYGLGAILVLVILVIILLIVLYGREITSKMFPESQSQNATEFQSSAGNASSLIR